MLEDFRLRVFLTVLKTGSFTDAARELGVTQPAVSQNVKELESSLGVTLLERGRGASLRLTPSGKAFEGYARQILHWYNAAELALKDGALPEPPVRIRLGDGREAEFWASQGDLHINFK